MSIPKTVKIKHGKLPITPGVYLFKDKKGKVVYVGKATNLKSRVFSYWKNVAATFRSPRGSLKTAATSAGSGRTIDEMLHEVARIDYVVTESVIEALIMEANLIRKYMPRYNVKEKDDKSFLYVVVTRGQWPKVELVRGNELIGVARDFMSRINGTQGAALRDARAAHYMRVFGPYTSASSIRAALDLMRKWFPWSMCKPGQRRPCFDYHIGRCPGVCVGAITRREYMKNIRNVILMLEGKKDRVMKNLELRMKNAAREEKFEEAEILKKKLFALQHIRDVAVLTKEPAYLRTQAPRHLSINILGRIEGYDISNLPAGKAGISGTNAVGSMVVFENGEAAKSEYRKFKIKTVTGINDVAMMREVLLRRFKNLNIESWGLPNLLVIDGGWGQVNVALEVLKDYRLKIPVVGIAKGFDRKQDHLIFTKSNSELAGIMNNHKELLQRVRDEAHRFAVSYHRKLRGRIYI